MNLEILKREYVEKQKTLIMEQIRACESEHSRLCKQEFALRRLLESWEGTQIASIIIGAAANTPLPDETPDK